MAKDAKGHGSDARGTLSKIGIPVGADYHTLNSSKVQGLVDAAKSAGYRKPDSANGSTGRYFHDKLQREVARSGPNNTAAASELASGAKSSTIATHDSMRVPDDGKPGGVGPGGIRRSFFRDPADHFVVKNPRLGGRYGEGEGF